MANRSFGEELSQELTGKAVIWGPVIGGALLLGPLGILLGLATSVAILSSNSNASSSPHGGDQDSRN
jgi:hypothetical protein